MKVAIAHGAGDRIRRIACTILLAVAVGVAAPAWACESPVSVCEQAGAGRFPLIRGGMPAAVWVEADADSAVRYAAEAFAGDLQRVGGKAARPVRAREQAREDLVIVGVLGQSKVIDRLVRTRKIDVSDLRNQWEAYRQIVVEQPLPGIPRALVIVGADRRGAVYGLYDLSEKVGVSPWHWFADVPVTHRDEVWLSAGSRRDQPKVKYRGFFINDEEPAFGSWARKRFGGFNASLYTQVFDLLLRLKGNTVWPAMWPPKAFNDDDPRNRVLADQLGVVMGTSHHEPMTRAHDEWRRNTASGITGGAWDYTRNGANLRAFWRGGIERMMSKGDGTPYESLVTIGMRGDGDEAMQAGTATHLLETIVADQRRIIAQVTGKPAGDTPQVWALYKEVQDYYDHGMTVPDDVILLFADDNWGQIRRLPTEATSRTGGYGVYYHFDYVGTPRNYKWLNTIQIEKTWQQMDLAYARGARSLWMVNVGDIKPMEFPLSFFMRQAWDPEAMTVEALARYPREWAQAQFGPQQAEMIADLLTRYSQYAARRKPELIDADSFALGEGAGDVLDGGEFGRRVEEWTVLETRARGYRNSVPKEQQSAYTQLVEHPIRAMANLYQLYYNVAWNRRLAARDDPRANLFATLAEAAFRHDGELTDSYHKLSDGKWDGMMAQTHIGYTGWQQPETQVMPKVERVELRGRTIPALRFKHSADATIETHDVIAIEAPSYSRAVDGATLRWTRVPHLGRTGGAVIALPQGQAATSPPDNVRLEYDVTLHHAGDLDVQLVLAPTLDVSGRNQLRVGVSVDDGPVTVLTDSLVPAPTDTTTQEQRDWNRAVEDNARVLRAKFAGVVAGPHIIKVWRLDDNVVLQRVVVANGAVPVSYLGPLPAQ